MDEQGKCVCCNSTHLAPGTLRSTGTVNFRPDDTKFLKLKTGNVDVKAWLCLDCGSVFLKADPQKVKELTEKK